MKTSAEKAKLPALPLGGKLPGKSMPGGMVKPKAQTPDNKKSAKNFKNLAKLSKRGKKKKAFGDKVQG